MRRLSVILLILLLLLPAALAEGDSASAFTFSWNEAGGYGQLLTFNAGTGSAYSFHAFPLLAGTYQVTNTSDANAAIVIVYAAGLTSDGGLEAPIPGQQAPLPLAPGEQGTITLRTGEYVRLSEGSVGVRFAAQADASAAAPQGDVQHYVLNSGTKKFHVPSCSSVEQISDKNRSEFDGTREEIIDMGYKPCGKCKP